MALLLALPLAACEPERVMERTGEALDDVDSDITDTVEDAKEEV